MNKTSIEWCDFTWNPVTGCLHGCRVTYCYNTLKSTAPLNRFGARYRENGIMVTEKNWRERETGANHVALQGEIYPYGYDPTFYPHRLIEPAKIKKPSRIFVVDTGDLFGDWVPADWIDKVLDVARACPQHTFQFLTRNPERYLSIDFPDNAWTGTSVNSDRDRDRAEMLRSVRAPVRYLSIEPLLGPVTFDLTGIGWIIVGAMTGRNPVLPETAWIDGIVAAARNNRIPVFFKANIETHYPDGRLFKEFP